MHSFILHPHFEKSGVHPLGFGCQKMSALGGLGTSARRLSSKELHREEYNRSDALSECCFYIDQSLLGLVAFGLESINTNASVAFAQSEFT